MFQPIVSCNPMLIVENGIFTHGMLQSCYWRQHSCTTLAYSHNGPKDLSTVPGTVSTRSLRDIPGWVELHHIEKMENLARFLLEGADLTPPIMQRAFRIAREHGKWPLDWKPIKFIERDAGLAALLALWPICSMRTPMRCDTATLLRHRYGTPLNCAHWIRHGLTAGRVLITAGRIRVAFARPPRTDSPLEPLFDALRNHYKLVQLYRCELEQVNASLVGIDFDPSTGLPGQESEDLDGWWRLPGFGVQSALRHHLFSSFMPEALLDKTRLSRETIERFSQLGLTPNRSD